MRSLAFAFGLALLPLTAFVGCSDDETGDTGTRDPSGSGSGASSASSAGPGPGSGGSGAEGGTGATGGTGSGGEPVGGSGTGGGTAGDHLLISELAAAPNTAAFVEIHNPTAAAVDLTDYYLSDNSAYYELSAGDPFDPITNNPGSDFLAKFPDGSSIPAGGYVVVALNVGFATAFAACPTFIISTENMPLDCQQMAVPAMDYIDPATAGDVPVGFSDNREMAILFRWDGTVGNPVEDVDYLTWGTEIVAGGRVDKTGVAGYQADTAVGMQKPAPVAAPTESIERCPQAVENGETTTGGNGISGHDETSESLDVSFKVQAAPTPGATNACN